MKTRFLLTAIVLLRAMAVSAQGQALEKTMEDWFLGSFFFEPGSVQTIFNDSTAVAASPGGAGNGLVLAYDSVRILVRSERWYRTAGLNAPWYKVGYTDRLRGLGDTGWLWGGDLAACAAVKEGVLFAIGSLRDTDSAYLKTPADSIHRLPWAICARTPDGKVQRAVYSIEEKAQLVEPAYHRFTGEFVIDTAFGPGPDWPVASRFTVSFAFYPVRLSPHPHYGGIFNVYKPTALWDGRRLIGLPVLNCYKDPHLVGGIYSVYCWPGEPDGRRNRLRIVTFTTGGSARRKKGWSLISKNMGSQTYRWNAKRAAFQ